jgi:hypothetical protein
MPPQEAYYLTISLDKSNTDIDDDDKEKETQRLFNELRTLDDIEDVQRVINPEPPEGSKAIAGFLIGLLTAEVKPENIANLFRFLGDRLSNKEVSLTLSLGDDVLEVTARSREEFEFAMEQALVWTQQRNLTST